MRTVRKLDEHLELPWAIAKSEPYSETAPNFRHVSQSAIGTTVRASKSAGGGRRGSPTPPTRIMKLVLENLG